MRDLHDREMERRIGIREERVVEDHERDEPSEADQRGLEEVTTLKRIKAKIDLDKATAKGVISAANEIGAGL